MEMEETNPFTQSVVSSRSAQAIMNEIQVELKRVFLGQDDVVKQVLASLLAGGHVLIEGKPGLGKTHLVLALANTFGADFGRIQFTPDLMPSDVSGFTLFDMKSQTFQLRKGPVFTNLLLADEINRAPAKTQSALLEVMQEQQVTIDGDSLPLDAPFMTLATENPIEQEGTYPLPEAQLDRFLMKVVIDYPAKATEEMIVSQVTQRAGGKGLNPNAVREVCTKQDILSAQQECADVRVVAEVVKYAVELCRATRETGVISLGAGTRGAISLIQVAKAYALMAGRDFVTPDDVKDASLPVLRHRVQLSPEFLISGQTVDEAVSQIVQSVEAPRI
ncbi:MoxR family ATPase [Persicirhabdus sediminis]|uniref:MoxR family ATPase n=2 Tax=Persicirhabdus sediminis TaxID=454144 RepID=A0A8J7M9T4_9BACT|nr:MoxR family ATPase [Persicirhabdus sediminis]